jgi:CRISPR/Cas system-associated protein Cas5 (RAMP superfamily)
MSFHPEKCNILSITKKLKRNPLTNCYILHGHQLEQVQSAKYLGVSITSDMKWSEHIANICKKANNTLSFLKRNLNISNSNLKENAASTFTNPFDILYTCSRISLAVLLLSSNDVHCSCPMISVTDEML